jgi:hypothetical protein
MLEPMKEGHSWPSYVKPKLIQVGRTKFSHAMASPALDLIHSTMKIRYDLAKWGLAGAPAVGYSSCDGVQDGFSPSFQPVEHPC